jgi:hypothetical protein
LFKGIPEAGGLCISGSDSDFRKEEGNWDVGIVLGWCPGGERKVFGWEFGGGWGWFVRRKYGFFVWRIDYVVCGFSGRVGFVVFERMISFLLLTDSFFLLLYVLPK